MTKQYDTQEQIDAFNIYVKQNPAGRQVHHTGTLGYDDDEWKAFQEGWNAALAQPDRESLDLFEYWNAVEGWVKIDEVRKHFDSVGCGTIYKTAGEDRVPVYTAPELNQFKPDWDTQAVLVEEMQRMAKRIEDLEAMLERQTACIVDLHTHIENFEGEDW